MEEAIKDSDRQMRAAVDAYQRDLGDVRTGRAGPKLLSRVKVQYQEMQMPIEHLANISAVDARTLMVQAWETEAVNAIAKAIQTSDLGVTPNISGDKIHITIPPLSEERRIQLVKMVKSRSEEGRIAIRNVRRDGMDSLKKQEKAGEYSKDELKRHQNHLQKITDSYIAEIDSIVAQKETEIMQV